jgi:hypothetical protein
MKHLDTSPAAVALNYVVMLHHLVNDCFLLYKLGNKRTHIIEIPIII